MGPKQTPAKSKAAARTKPAAKTPPKTNSSMKAPPANPGGAGNTTIPPPTDLGGKNNNPPTKLGGKPANPPTVLGGKPTNPPTKLGGKSTYPPTNLGGAVSSSQLPRAHLGKSAPTNVMGCTPTHLIKPPTGLGSSTTAKQLFNRTLAAPIGTHPPNLNKSTGAAAAAAKQTPWGTDDLIIDVSHVNEIFGNVHTPRMANLIEIARTERNGGSIFRHIEISLDGNTYHELQVSSDEPSEDQEDWITIITKEEFIALFPLNNTAFDKACEKLMKDGAQLLRATLLLAGIDPEWTKRETWTGLSNVLVNKLDLGQARHFALPMLFRTQNTGGVPLFGLFPNENTIPRNSYTTETIKWSYKGPEKLFRMKNEDWKTANAKCTTAWTLFLHFYEADVNTYPRSWPMGQLKIWLQNIINSASQIDGSIFDTTEVEDDITDYELMKDWLGASPPRGDIHLVHWKYLMNAAVKASCGNANVNPKLGAKICELDLWNSIAQYPLTGPMIFFGVDKYDIWYENVQAAKKRALGTPGEDTVIDKDDKGMMDSLDNMFNMDSMSDMHHAEQTNEKSSATQLDASRYKSDERLLPAEGRSPAGKRSVDDRAMIVDSEDSSDEDAEFATDLLVDQLETELKEAEEQGGIITSQGKKMYTTQQMNNINRIKDALKIAEDKQALEIQQQAEQQAHDEQMGQVDLEQLGLGESEVEQPEQTPGTQQSEQQQSTDQQQQDGINDVGQTNAELDGPMDPATRALVRLQEEQMRMMREQLRAQNQMMKEQRDEFTRALNNRDNNEGDGWKDKFQDLQRQMIEMGNNRDPQNKDNDSSKEESRDKTVGPNGTALLRDCNSVAKIALLSNTEWENACNDYVIPRRKDDVTAADVIKTLTFGVRHKPSVGETEKNSITWEWRRLPPPKASVEDVRWVDQAEQIRKFCLAGEDKNPINQRIEVVAKFLNISVRTFASCTSDNNAVHKLELSLNKKQVSEALVKLICHEIESEVQLVGKIDNNFAAYPILLKNNDVRTLCTRTIELVRNRGAKTLNLRTYKFNNIDVVAACKLYVKARKSLKCSALKFVDELYENPGLHTGIAVPSSKAQTDPWQLQEDEPESLISELLEFYDIVKDTEVSDLEKWLDEKGWCTYGWRALETILIPVITWVCQRGGRMDTEANKGSKHWITVEKFLDDNETPIKTFFSMRVMKYDSFAGCKLKPNSTPLGVGGATAPTQTRPLSHVPTGGGPSSSANPNQPSNTPWGYDDGASLWGSNYNANPAMLKETPYDRRQRLLQQHRDKVAPFTHIQYIDGKPTINGGNTGGFTQFPTDLWEIDNEGTHKPTKVGCVFYAKQTLGAVDLSLEQVTKNNTLTPWINTHAIQGQAPTVVSGYHVETYSNPDTSGRRIRLDGFYPLMWFLVPPRGNTQRDFSVCKWRGACGVTGLSSGWLVANGDCGGALCGDECTGRKHPGLNLRHSISGDQIHRSQEDRLIFDTSESGLKFGIMSHGYFTAHADLVKKQLWNIFADPTKSPTDRKWMNEDLNATKWRRTEKGKSTGNKNNYQNKSGFDNWNNTGKSQSGKGNFGKNDWSDWTGAGKSDWSGSSKNGWGNNGKNGGNKGNKGSGKKGVKKGGKW